MRSLSVLMSRRDAKGLKLSQAHACGCLIRVRCNCCRVTRHYDPADMAFLLGDVEVDSLMGRTCCEKCGHRDYTEVSGITFPTAGRLRIKVRRLVRVDIIRRPVWREE